MRLSKTVGNIQYTYLYLGGLLMQETRGSRILDYFYDANGQAIAVRYKSNANAAGTYYYYAYNWRGDIVGLYSENGNPECTYTYDAWGKLLSVKNPAGTEMTSATYIGNLQSLKYRGYVYDRETGLYYLQSRYYDPVTRRFINTDDVDVPLLSGANVYNKNLFAYCDNNPIIRKDDSGDFWLCAILIGAAVGALVSGGVSAASQYVETGEVNWGVVAVNAVSGAISGACASVGCVTLPVSIGVNAGLGLTTYVAEQAIKKEDVTVDGLVRNTLAGAFGGFIGGSGTDAEGLYQTWKAARKEIAKQAARETTKQTTKHIAKCVATKKEAISTLTIAFGRYCLGAFEQKVLSK